MRRYWNEIKTAWVQGNLWTRLSLLVMGSGYCACDRWGKGILMTLMEVFFFSLQEGILAVYQKIKYIRNRAEKGNTGSYNITKDGKSL